MMRTNPRRQSPVARVEALESRNLLSTATVSAPPTVAYVQFEPLTGRIVVSFTGDPSGYDLATLTNPANYGLVPVTTKQKLPNPDPSRPDVGVNLAPEFKVTGVTLPDSAVAGQAETLIVSIDDNQPIKFGTYQFTINGSAISDNAGNELDGAYSGVFPSGDGQPGSDFVANLTQTHSTILPPAPVTLPQSQATASAVVPTDVFVPSTRQFRIRYLASRPAVFQLAGGNKIRLQALPHQYFPGTYRAPTKSS